MEVLIDAEFHTIIPPLAAEEYKALEESIVAEGCRDALVIWKEKSVIVDGHNRYDICTKHNIPYRTFEKSFADRESAIDWIDANQLARRNLSPDQMSLLRGRRYNRIKQKHGGQIPNSRIAQNELSLPTAKTLAKQYGVSSPTIKRDAQFATAIQRLETNLPEISKKVLRGEFSKQDVKVLDGLKPEQQIKVVAIVDNKEATNIYNARRLMMREEVSNIIPPTGKYQVIYADPPWEYEGGLDIHGAALRHYPTMTIGELCKLPIKDIADDNAVLFLWVTSPKLNECWGIIEAWGFEYKTSFVWDKIEHVMGRYNSVRHELLLVCIRGSYPKQSDKLHDSVISLERTDHSVKPDYFRELIGEMYPKAQKIELFAQKKIDDWNTWGNIL